MVTKESLLARRAQIESDLAVQHEIARAAEGQRQEAIAKLTGCRDMVNALSGAKQDVEHWLARFHAEPTEETTPAAPAIAEAEGTDKERPN